MKFLHVIATIIFVIALLTLMVSGVLFLAHMIHVWFPMTRNLTTFEVVATAVGSGVVTAVSAYLVDATDK